MAVLATAVYVDGTRYEAGTTPPANISDEIRNPAAWVGGVAPPLTGGGYIGKPRLSSSDMVSALALRTALGLGTAAVRNVGVTPAEVAAGGPRVPTIVGAPAGAQLIYDPEVPGGLVWRVVNGGGGTGVAITYPLTTVPMGPSGVFTSAPFERGQPFPNDIYSMTRLQVTANTLYSATMQSSSDALTWADALSYTVTSGASTHVVDQAAVPTARYLRWVITAIGANMITMDAKVTLT